jgi:hypothetical protein
LQEVEERVEVEEEAGRMGKGQGSICCLAPHWYSHAREGIVG